MPYDSNYGAVAAPNELAYDLREIYAKIVGEHLIDAAEARKANDFYAWYKALEDIHTIIRHKFKKPKEDEADYWTHRNAIIEEARRFPAAWSNCTGQEEERASIEYRLRKLEEFLYLKMSEAKMFGEGGKIAGL